jgi:hypothetical protein
VVLGQQVGSPKASQATIWVESSSGDSWSISAGRGISKGRGGWILSLGTIPAAFQLRLA